MIQVIMVLMLPLFTRSKPEMDADGNVKPAGTGILAKTLVALRYTCFLALYGGVITVIYALFTITPETATGAGSDWLRFLPCRPTVLGRFRAGLEVTSDGSDGPEGWMV